MTSFIDVFAGLTEGVAQKSPCQCATTADLGTGLTGLPVIDGYQLLLNDRILVKNQADQTTNGIYVASTGAWTRAVDFNDPTDIVQGTVVVINNGTLNANRQFKITTPNPVPGSAIAFAQSSFDASGYLKTDGSIPSTGTQAFGNITTTGTATFGSTASFAGAVTIIAPVSNLNPATKKYVDDSIAALVITTTPPGVGAPFFGGAVPSGWLLCDGSAVSRATYAALFAALIVSATVTITIASPGVISWAAHGRLANDPVKFKTSGALPTGLVANTTYYVVGGASLHAGDFQVSATPGGAAINTSGTQSGTHTGFFAPWGDGDGSTTFNLPNPQGYVFRGLDRAGSVDANRAFASTQADAVGAHTHDIAYLLGLLGTSSAGSINVGAGSAVTTSNQQPAPVGETRVKNIAVPWIIKT
jgi:microcystin-dependent protein